MSDRRIVLGSLLALGFAVGGGWLISHGSSPASAATDGPGPNLVIEVAGATTGTIVIDLLPEVAPKHVEQIDGAGERGRL